MICSSCSNCCNCSTSSEVFVSLARFSLLFAWGLMRTEVNKRSHSLKHLYCNPRVSKKYLAADACAWARWDRRGLERGLVRRLALPKSSVPCSFKLLVFTWHVTAFAALTHCRFTWRVCVQRQSQQLTTASKPQPPPRRTAPCCSTTRGKMHRGVCCPRLGI